MPVCPYELIKKPLSQRCIKKTGRIGLRVVNPEACPTPYVMNELTGRCLKATNLAGITARYHRQGVLFGNAVMKAYQTKLSLKGSPTRIYTRLKNKFTLNYLLGKFPECAELVPYGKDALNDAFITGSERPPIDFIYTLDPDKNIVAILFAHRGECYPDIWNVKLVCGVSAGDAAVLLGAYCYALKSIASNIGLLEVARDYTNLKAYCLYEKFGFTETYKRQNWPTATGRFECPKFDYILSMYTDLSDFSLDDIVTIAASNRGKTAKSPICASKDSPARQRLLIRNNLARFTPRRGLRSMN
jgi:hypothetical protein